MKMEKKNTLCWVCEWAAGKDEKCPWACKFEPVPGWNATPTKVKADKQSVHREIDSFIVHECPEFKMLEELQRRKIARSENYTKYKTGDYAEIHRLRDLGKSYKEIAGILGVSDKSIYRAMKRERLKRDGV